MLKYLKYNKFDIFLYVVLLALAVTIITIMNNKENEEKLIQDKYIIGLEETNKELISDVWDLKETLDKIYHESLEKDEIIKELQGDDK